MNRLANTTNMTMKVRYWSKTSETFGEGLLDCAPFFGSDVLTDATFFITSAIRVVVPTDRDTDRTGLLVEGTA